MRLHSALVCVFLLLLCIPSKAGKDYYKILGVKRDVDEKQLKRAYKKKAMVWHPDKHQENKDRATAKFQEIAEAYETLSDPEKRRVYDLGGEEAVKGQPPPQSESPGSKPQGGAQGPSGSRTQEVDPEMMRRAFSSMFGSAGSDPRFQSDGSYSFVFHGMPSMGKGAPHSFPHGMPSMGPNGAKPKQGAQMFGDGPVRELPFKEHEAHIGKLRELGFTLVLFYASGGNSCPKACHAIREHYMALAEKRGRRLPVAAVQCLRRRGKCAKYADRLPAVVLLGAQASEERVLSEGKAQNLAQLEHLLDQALATSNGHRRGTTATSRGGAHHSPARLEEELRPQHFDVGGDPCGGQFCLLLLEYGTPIQARKARRALAAAATKLSTEPVRAFHVRATHNPGFAGAFVGKRASASGTTKAQVLLYRPRRMHYHFFEGSVEDTDSLAEFVTRAINQGHPLPHKLSYRPRLQA